MILAVQAVVQAIETYKELGQCFAITFNSSPADALAVSLV